MLALGPAAKTLDATHNKVAGVPNRIKDLANLRNLMLAHNGLTALNPHISFLTNLKVRPDVGIPMECPNTSIFSEVLPV